MHHHHGRLRTMGLLAFLFAMVMLVGAIVAYSTNSPAFLFVFAGIGVFSVAYSYWNSDKIATRAMRAYPVSREQAPALYEMVEELAHRAQQPVPRIFIAPNPTPNAFATGRNPNKGVVCYTEGILNLLTPRELRAVTGHELMHIYNRDILISSVAAAVAGFLTTITQFFILFGGGRGRGQQQNPLMLIGSILAVILMPIAASLIRSSISRTREYDADSDGAELSGDPLALASALDKLQNGISRIPLQEDPKHDAHAHMMIANPFGPRAKQMFSTHPPMEDRIARLKEMAGYRD
ncbi:M48 family metalloprotease [Nesterenkonia sp. MY13]|uniref:Protease HtpX homolog n=1 Tax=Nesterenkonia sedimenti TaxID=1463632 RepID=A0A7X8YEE3_9MICC|nr:M48 family metalloprotease [Nesterenkonia sedimenti]NLS10733.1 M48 family metalloprotease [Nesterenkonia sedimenti]